MNYFFLLFLFEEELLFLLEEELLLLEREELELREERLTVEREELELRLGFEVLLPEDDCLATELLEDVREGVLRMELLEDFELREGAVAARPLEEADEEEVEENFRTKFWVALFFSVEVEDLFAVLFRDGVWEREEEKRFTILLLDEGSLLVSAERLTVVRFTLWVEDLNLEGTILFPCVVELLDVTDFCELGEYLFMYREEIPDFEIPPPV